MSQRAPRGTVAIEEAVLNPDGISWMAESATLYNPGQDPTKLANHGHTKSLVDIHSSRLAQMDEHGVEYMLLSLTSPGAQGEPDPAKALKISIDANNWLAEQVALNPARFGAFASVSMHDAAEAAAEATRAVKELGKKYFDAEEYLPFWQVMEELGVPVYLHPRYPPAKDLEKGTRYGDRKQILGAAVQFHLDLSMHIYALCSSGVFDKFPKLQVVCGHLGEGIPFNLWRADHWYNKPVKKATRPSKHDYSYYFTHNVSITSSGDFSTEGLKFCIDAIGADRCLFSIDYPYDTIEEAQDWWKAIQLPEEQKLAIGRENAIKLFKLPLEL
ncbi:hypothetical protein B0T17DRAFT_634135 [Bombardia bombarda]|uniref:Amidohydrolase-related domain-containing protein n=1 Tax=Bombardia bombarda TaxID=252184 RepID=A0AA40C8G2_9PEZI|nr:hypothetical protein B0T17DRAFT_634135 [Bombardia bombarda]